MCSSKGEEYVLCLKGIEYLWKVYKVWSVILYEGVTQQISKKEKEKSSFETRYATDGCSETARQHTY